MSLKLVRYLLCGLAISLTGLPAQAIDNTAMDVIKVEVTGTIRTGLVAIGGETTGTVIRSNGVTWELDLSKNPKLKTTATQLNGKKVTVSGTYERRRGVEIPQREIVTVTKLTAARSK